MIEVMLATTITCVSFTLFSLASIQLMRLFDDTYAPASVNALRAQGISVDLHRDEQVSLAAFAGPGDLLLDGVPFPGTDYPSSASQAAWIQSERVLADLTVFFAARGRTLSVSPNVPGSKASWLLFLGENGKITAFYRFVCYDDASSVGYWSVVERYCTVGVSSSATRTLFVSIFTPTGDTAVTDRGLPATRAEFNPGTHETTVTLPLAFNSAQALSDRPVATLEGRFSSPGTVTVHCRFQP